MVVDGTLYVRAYHGTGSRWFRAALRQRAGEVHAGGSTWAVTFAPAPSGVDAAVDEAHLARYVGDPYLGHMLGPASRDASVVINPRRGG